MYDKWLTLLAQYFNWFIGATGVVASYFFGGWNEALSLLVILALLDFVSGMGASVSEGVRNPNDPTKGLNSRKGFKGIAKKAAMFAIIAVLYRIDFILGLNGILSLSVGATYFYLSNELISLFENYGRLGLPMPPQIKKAISALKSKSDVQSIRSERDDEVDK